MLVNFKRNLYFINFKSLYPTDEEEADALPEEDQSDVELSDAESDESRKSNRNQKSKNSVTKSDSEERDIPIVDDGSESEEMALDI